MAQNKIRRALGRGLTNLIPIDSEEKGSGNDILYVDINSISVNPFQPRQDFNKDEIKNLAESIKSQGLLQPIILRKTGNKYEIISGERRFRAMKYLGDNKIPSIIKAKISDNEMLEMALVENIQREDLNDIEVAHSYQKLLFDCGLSHRELSTRVGKSRSVITNTLRLLKLPRKIQDMIRKGQISSGHARALLSIKNSQDQYSLAQKIISRNLSVREIESIAQAKSDKRKKQGKKGAKNRKIKYGNFSDPDIQYQEEQLRYHFGTDVKILMKENYKGKIEINYYTKQDLERILNIVLK
jgi:ParB family chromosome partitioning protein